MALTVRQSRMLGTSDGAAATVAPAVLLPKSPWVSQPQVPVGIDWSNPITRGLQLVENLNERNRAVTGGANTLNGTSQQAGLGGIGATFAASDSIICPVIADSAQKSFICVSVAKGTGAGGNFGRFFDSRISATIGYAAWRDDNSGVEVFNRGFSIANGQWAWPSYTAGNLNNLAISYDGSSTSNQPVVIRNGIKQTISINVAPSGTLNTVTDPITIGNRRTDNLRNWSGQIYLFAVWDRVLSESELNSISQNPWQIFRPLTKQIWVAP